MLFLLEEIRIVARDQKSILFFVVKDFYIKTRIYERMLRVSQNRRHLVKNGIAVREKIMKRGNDNQNVIENILNNKTSLNNKSSVLHI